jgi:hypothetical protein
LAKQQKVNIAIPSGYTPQEREAIALEVVEFIRERSQKGRDKDNKSFVGYSQSYQKSLDFKIAGKSGKVDLILSGDMLAALDVLKTSSRSLTIGYEAGDSINGRVEGNRIGSYGGKPNAKRARDFLGISREDLTKILRKYPQNTDESLDRAAQILEVNERASEAADGVD